jgi:hypothetical protein
LSLGITQQEINMSDLSLFITNLESKSKQLAGNIETSFANHNQLLGYTNAINEILGIVSPLVSALFPADSSEIAVVSTTINEVQSGINSILTAPLTTPA